MTCAGREVLIEKGMEAGEVDMMPEDRIWSLHSRDKVDISEVLMEVVAGLHRSILPCVPLRALSIGSGFEPQFQILEAAFRGGLWLLDIDRVPLEQVRKEAADRWIDHVTTVTGDYNALLGDRESCSGFREREMGGEKAHLITLHHSLYYSDASSWKALFEGLLTEILEDRGAVHAVLMSSACSDENSTTWIYNHFAGKCCGRVNDQDLAAFAGSIAGKGFLKGASVNVTTSRVNFFVNDFEKMMSVVWMILLYPGENHFDRPGRRKITEFVHDRFWIQRKPLVQLQDHLIIERR